MSLKPSRPNKEICVPPSNVLRPFVGCIHLVLCQHDLVGIWQKFSHIPLCSQLVLPSSNWSSRNKCFRAATHIHSFPHFCVIMGAYYIIFCSRFSYSISLYLGDYSLSIHKGLYPLFGYIWLSELIICCYTLDSFWPPEWTLLKWITLVHVSFLLYLCNTFIEGSSTHTFVIKESIFL